MLVLESHEHSCVSDSKGKISIVQMRNNWVVGVNVMLAG